MKVGVPADDWVCIELDRHSLSLDNGCQLRGLSGRVRIRSDLERGQLWYLRVVDSPSLRKLDLTHLPGGFDLDLDSSSHPEQVLLPEDGASLLLTVARGFPGTRIRGRIEECQVTCVSNHVVAGCYRLESCEDLALLSDGRLEPHPTTGPHLRIDQSERGLQIKTLRPRVKPDEVRWRLLRSGNAHDPTADYLGTLRADEFSRLALSDAPDIERRRRPLLENTRCGPSTCRLLERLLRRGFNPRAIWAWRCMVQAALGADPAPERVGPALLKARARWPSRRWGGRHEQASCPIDLRLMMLCRPTGLVRRCERQLLEKGEPLGLAALVAFAASLPPGHPWSGRVDRMIEASMNRYRALGILEREKVERSGRQHRWHLDGRAQRIWTFMEDLLRHAERIPNGNLRNRILRLTSDILSPGERIRLGVKLHKKGEAVARQLVMSGVQASPDCGPRLHARAMRCLLGPD